MLSAAFCMHLSVKSNLILITVYYSWFFKRLLRWRLRISFVHEELLVVDEVDTESISRHSSWTFGLGGAFATDLAALHVRCLMHNSLLSTHITISIHILLLSRYLPQFEELTGRVIHLSLEGAELR